MRQIPVAIKAKDFDTFACLAMQDSHQFHAVVLGTDLPIFYMDDVSQTSAKHDRHHHRVPGSPATRFKKSIIEVVVGVEFMIAPVMILRIVGIKDMEDESHGAHTGFFQQLHNP
jgi:hypothetical protein